MLLLLRPFDYWSRGHQISEGQLDLRLLRVQRTLAILQQQQNTWRDEIDFDSDLLMMLNV